MVIDSSALIAILTREPEAERLALAIELDSVRLVSAASVLETAIVLTARYGEPAANDLDLLLVRAAVEIVPVTVEHVNIARRAYLRYGKGRHPAALNFGDCFTYALTKAADQPVLCVGTDFARTDLPVLPLP